MLNARTMSRKTRVQEVNKLTIGSGSQVDFCHWKISAGIVTAAEEIN